MSFQYPPVATWSDDDHSGPVIIITVLCMFYWLIPGIIQQAVSFTRDIRFTWAEGLFTLSMVSGIVQAALVLAACHHGFAKSTSELRRDQVSQAQQYYYVSNIFYVLVLGLIKCSAALWIAHTTIYERNSLRHASRSHKLALYGVLVLAIAWIVSSIVLLVVPCGSQVTCIATMSRWRGIFAGDAVSDIAIAVFAANVIWRTQASVHVRLMWYIPFFFRLCVPICAGLRLLTLNEQRLIDNPTLAPWLFAILSQIQILLSLIGGTSPAVKKTVLDLVTNYGAMTDSAANSRAKSKTGGSIPLNDLRSYKSRDQGSTTSQGARRFVPFTGGSSHKNRVVVERSNVDNDDGDGDSQKGIIRRDEVEISYANADE